MAVAKEYKNHRLLKETFFKNKNIVLEKEYYAMEISKRNTSERMA